MNQSIAIRLRTTTFLLCLVFLTACGDSPDAMIQSAKDYLAKSDNTAATIQLKNALAKNPNSGEARFLLGRALLDSGDVVAAEVELRKAVELNYAVEQVTPVLARVLLAQGQVKKLDELAKTLISSPEALADLKTTLAQSHAMQGKFDAAKATLEEAIAAKSDYAPALLGLAQLKVRSNDLPGARAIIEEILTKDPKNANAWLFKADMLRAEGKTAEAIPAYEKGIELQPRALSAYAALIMIHLRDRKIELATTQLEAMQKVATKHPLTFYMQGLIAYGRKDIPAARTAVENLLKMQPENAQALQLAGLIAYESRSDALAQEFLRKALQKAPGLDFSRRTLVMSYLRSGQAVKAIETLQPVLHGSETRTSWLAIAGNAYMQSGDVKTAEEYYQRAAKADPENKQTQTALALARMRTGNANEAFDDLEEIASEDKGISADMALIASHVRQKQYDNALKAIANLEKKQPDNPVVHNLRGSALLGKGDSEGARKSFEKALSINPAYMPSATALAQLDILAKKPEDARTRYEAVLSKEPKNVQALLALAELQAHVGVKPEEIAAQIGKAIAAAPNEATPRLALIGLHVRHKDYKRALTAMQEALAAMPERPELLDVAGQVYQLNGDTNQALAVYGKLTTLMPTAVHPYLRMAEVQVAAKNKEGARASLNKGLSLQPNSLQMQRALIMLDVDDKRFDAALAKARDIQKKQPKLNAGFVLEGDIHVINKSWGQATAAYRAGLKIAQATDLAERLYATLIMDGKYGEAKASADTWIKAHPKDNAFRLFLAESANKRKDYAAAAAQYQDLLAAQPNNPAVLNNLAWSLGQMKDPKAIGYAEQANKLAPNQPAIMDTLGMLLIEQGKIGTGLELLSKALQLSPDAHAVRLNYAKALIKTAKKSEAKQQLEELAKLGDKFAAQNEVSALLKGL